MRLAITSDLHVDLDAPRTGLTPIKTVYGLARRMMQEKPDAIVLAGDLGHGLLNFSTCLQCFDVGVPVGVVAGNHDIWICDDCTSEELLRERLPAITREHGYSWLETDSMRVGDVSIVGSLAWYDYTGADASVRANVTDAAFAIAKAGISNDANMIDWDRYDPDVACELGDAMLLRFQREAVDEAVRAIAVVTHVPLFEEQMTRRESWAMSNAYYGNLTLGGKIVHEPKLRTVVSGHTHAGKRSGRERGTLGSVEMRVVGSDYRNPSFTIVEV